MRVIILAAGQSKRFQKAGYLIPKPFLMVEWNGAKMTMLEHVINTIPIEFGHIDIAIPTGCEKQVMEFRHLNDGVRIYLHSLQPTKGPAETAKRVLESIRHDSCLILDTDILNSTNDILKLTKLNHCGVLVRRSANPSYSYVDRLGEFEHIKEKERISEYAVQGAYYVPRTAISEFMSVMDNAVNLELEPYISHVFDRLSLLKYAVPTTYIPVDWGTPQDVALSGALIISETVFEPRLE